MTKPDKIFDDLAQLAGGAAGLLSGLRQQLQSDIKNRVDEMAARLDLVPRDEVERLEAMVNKMRDNQEALEKRLEALEPRLDKKKTGKDKKS